MQWIATGGVKADACASPNPTLNKALLLLHVGRVQMRGRDRRECKKKKKRERRGNEKLNYDSRTKSIQLWNIRRKMKVRLLLHTERYKQERERGRVGSAKKKRKWKNREPETKLWWQDKDKSQLWNIQRKMKVRLRDWCTWSNQGNDTLPPSSPTVTWCDVMWCDVMWCDVMWCDVMWCDVMWGEVRWDEMRWGDVMWYEMRWDEMRWD